MDTLIIPEKRHRSSIGATHKYVLMTAAYNEAANIERTIQSVVAQTVRPLKWVIVSDNSTDQTDQIVQSYAEKYPFIRLLRVDRNAGHNFGAKVLALRRAEKLFDGIDYDFIGNLDADISLDGRYYEELLEHFERDPKLGITSGFVHEDHGNGFRSRWFNSVANVPHAAQLVRRECYRAIDGYAVLKYGGEDWYAQTCAKMRGWHVEAFPQLEVLHHRHTGGSTHPLRSAFRLGRLDYSFGTGLVFEAAKCARKFRDKPYVLAGVTRLLGFAWSLLSREERAVSREFADFLRQEQRSRIPLLKSSPLPQNQSVAEMDKP
jgi:glycosyltransferase involved in cell wall biosynthesis